MHGRPAVACRPAPTPAAHPRVPVGAGLRPVRLGQDRLGRVVVDRGPDPRAGCWRRRPRPADHHGARCRAGQGGGVGPVRIGRGCVAGPLKPTAAAMPRGDTDAPSGDPVLGACRISRSEKEDLPLTSDSHARPSPPGHGGRDPATVGAGAGVIAPRAGRDRGVADRPRAGRDDTTIQGQDATQQAARAAASLPTSAAASWATVRTFVDAVSAASTSHGSADREPQVANRRAARGPPHHPRGQLTAASGSSSRRFGRGRRGAAASRGGKPRWWPRPARSGARERGRRLADRRAAVQTVPRPSTAPHAGE